MFDFGCHRIEVFLNLFGSIRETRSLMGNVLFSREVEDTAVAMFKFESGLQAVLSVTHAAHDSADTLEIYGSTGSIKTSALNQGTIAIKNQNGERVENHPPHSNPHQPLIDDFVQAVLCKRQPHADGLKGREVARVEARIYEQSAVD
jgi:predicted dehydrogenase